MIQSNSDISNHDMPKRIFGLSRYRVIEKKISFQIFLMKKNNVTKK